MGTNQMVCPDSVNSVYLYLRRQVYLTTYAFFTGVLRDEAPGKVNTSAPSTGIKHDRKLSYRTPMRYQCFILFTLTFHLYVMDYLSFISQGNIPYFKCLEQQM